MKPKIFLLLISVLLAVLIVQPAHANTVTLSDPLGSGQHILVYEVAGNGTVLVGEYNLTDTIELSGDNYVLTLKPGGAALVQNPGIALDWLLGAILIVFVLIFALVFALAVGRIILTAFKVK